MLGCKYYINKQNNACIIVLSFEADMYNKNEADNILAMNKLESSATIIEDGIQKGRE